jgi:hypothetical protein
MEKSDRGEPGVAVDDLLSPSNIAGIEVYSSGNAAPPAYQLLNGSCAVVSGAASGVSGCVLSPHALGPSPTAAANMAMREIVDLMARYLTRDV